MITEKYRLTVETVEPSGTELPDRVNLIMQAEGSYAPLFVTYQFLSQYGNYRVRLSKFVIHESYESLLFKKSDQDNPFVT